MTGLTLWLPNFFKAMFGRSAVRSVFLDAVAQPHVLDRVVRTQREDLHANQEVDCNSGLPSAVQPIRVLHIEDDLSVVSAVGWLLRLNGYAVRSGATQSEVMSHFNFNGWRPDIILADYLLAGRTTSESIVAEVALRMGSKPPTIVLAGTMESLGRRACEAFADRVLNKPIDREVLLREIEALLGRRA